MQIFQESNIHACPQCPCEVFNSAKKLDQHDRSHHFDTRTVTNTALCSTHIQGTLPPNFDHILSNVLQFIDKNVASNPENFRLGLQEKLTAPILDEFDDIFMGIIKACVEASQISVGNE